MAKRRVVIVGGGYAGVKIAAALDSTVDVTLVEKNEYFVHNVALIRAVVDLEWLKKIFFPYSGLLRQGRVVRGKAVEIKPGKVILEDGTELPADDIVLATGSSSPTPFKPAGSISDLVKSVQTIHSRVKEAKSIAIVGGGTVGLELAGELASYFPTKRTTLISSSAEYLPEYGKAIGKSLSSQLQKMGVRTIMGHRATNLSPTDQPYGPTTLELDNGTKIEADLVFPAIGSKPVVNLPDVPLKNGKIRVNKDLSVVGLPGVWAVGDAADTGDFMSIVALQKQVPYLVKQLKARSTGGSPPAEGYTAATNPPVIVPLGPKGGASKLPFGTLGSWTTSFIKGKGLFTDQTRKELGATAAVSKLP